MQWRNFEVDGSFAPVDLEPGEWNAFGYETEVVQDLERIGETAMGRLLYGYLTVPVLVIPWDYAHQEVNASAHPGAGLDAAALDYGLPGAGAPVIVVKFTPSLFVSPDSPLGSTYPGLHPMHSDAALFHELFHALEMAWGTLQEGILGPNAGDMLPEAEHRATRFANMYHSETHRPLRAAYLHTAPLTSSGQDYSTGGLTALHRRIGHGFALMGYRSLRKVVRVPGDARHDYYVLWEAYQAKRLTYDHPGLTAVLEQIPESVCDYNLCRDFVRGYPHVYLPEPWLPGPVFDRGPDLDPNYHRTG